MLFNCVSTIIFYHNQMFFSILIHISIVRCNYKINLTRIYLIIQKLSKLLVFHPFQSAISERVNISESIQSKHFKDFPFHCTLKISYPAQIDTWHLSMHSACLARENVADNESRDRNGSGRNTGKRSKKIEPVRETGLDNSRCHAGKRFSFQIYLDVSGFGNFPVLMCCYRLAVQIKRREVCT